MLSQPRFAAIWLAVKALCGELEDDFDGELEDEGLSEAADTDVDGSSDDPEFEVAWLHPAVPRVTQMAAAMAMRFMPAYVSTDLVVAAGGARKRKREVNDHYSGSVHEPSRARHGGLSA